MEGHRFSDLQKVAGQLLESLRRVQIEVDQLSAAYPSHGQMAPRLADQADAYGGSNWSEMGSDFSGVQRDKERAQHQKPVQQAL